jgi:hypothetical protein
MKSKKEKQKYGRMVGEKTMGERVGRREKKKRIQGMWSQ